MTKIMVSPEPKTRELQKVINSCSCIKMVDICKKCQKKSSNFGDNCCSCVKIAVYKKHLLKQVSIERKRLFRENYEDSNLIPFHISRFFVKNGPKDQNLPLAVDKDGIDQETIDRELEIAKDLARQEGKPEEILEKIAFGRLNKFYKENTLLNQAFIKDGKKTVAQYLKDQHDSLSVTCFKRVGLSN